MKLAVVGAGWAGLAAAVRLHQAGHDVTVYEAATQPGGRARPVLHPGLGLASDNGQHILLGAYHGTFTLMRSLGIDPSQVCHIEPLNLQSADGSLRLRFWPLPAPAHRLGALFGSRGLYGWRGRRHLWRLLHTLSPEHLPAALTVHDWMAQLGCPPGLLDELWAPLCLAATNTPIERTQARLFAHLLRDSLGAGAGASQLYIPRAQLHDLWPRQACQLLGHRLRRQRVSVIHRDADGRWIIDASVHDGLVLATPHHEARRLLASLSGAEDYLSTWPALDHAAIGTLSLRLARPWRSGLSMVLLQDDPSRDAWGQWLFDRSMTATNRDEQQRVHITIGAADRYRHRTTDQIATGIIAQVRQQATTPLPPIEARALITEKRATFDVTPGLVRPGALTPWPGLVLAGDWTDTGYPAVLEGAVRSGLKAAALLLSDGSACSCQTGSRSAPPPLLPCHCAHPGRD